MTVEEDDMHCIDIMVTNREKDLTYIYLKLQVCRYCSNTGVWGQGNQLGVQTLLGFPQWSLD